MKKSSQRSKHFIVIAGNMGSGKTTLAETLTKILPNYTFISIDECRWRFMHATPISREQKAQETFSNLIQQHDRIILETTGSGKAWKYAKWAMQTHDRFIVRISCPISVCRQRVKQRRKVTPLPCKFDLTTSLNLMEEELGTIKPNVKVSHDMAIHEQLHFLIQNGILEYELSARLQANPSQCPPAESHAYRRTDRGGYLGKRYGQDD
ncbi:AAA family ATPase [Limibacter armeniacum]|uniref:AAA family ATPase n=1 Tax=Limibacter armeniacum TaxID=466084 RepID=UPI002FE5B8C7